MNILLWILQGVLAVLYLSGGAYKLAKPDELAKFKTPIPRGAWAPLGGVEIIGALVLVVAPLLGRPELVSIAACVLAAETLMLAAFYAQVSRRFVAANPMAWALIMGLLAATLAIGRYIVPNGT